MFTFIEYFTSLKKLPAEKTSIFCLAVKRTYIGEVFHERP
jgi:hypothetical protein